MKFLSLIAFFISFSALAQSTEKFYVPNGDTETTITRNSGETRKQTAVFSWQEEVQGTEQICVARDVRYRLIYCRDRRGRVYVCGQRAYSYCVRYETRTYTRIVNHKYNVKLKFKKSARSAYRGVEEYLVKFDKPSRCAIVSAANTNAERRMIENNSCRKAVIR